MISNCTWAQPRELGHLRGHPGQEFVLRLPLSLSKTRLLFSLSLSQQDLRRKGPYNTIQAQNAEIYPLYLQKIYRISQEFCSCSDFWLYGYLLPQNLTTVAA